MGSQQTRLSQFSDSKIPNDICIAIFSFINSAKEFSTILNFSQVCRQWRVIIVHHLGLHLKFHEIYSERQLSRAVSLIPDYYFKSIWFEKSLLGRETLCKLSKMKSIKKVQELNVNNNNIREECMAFVASSMKLQVLRVRNNDINNSGMESIAKMKTLQILDICKNPISEIGFNMLFGSGCCLQNLTELSVGPFETFGPEGAKTISSSFKLRKLEMISCGIGNEGLNTIINSPNMVNLKALNVEGNGINNEGIKFLLESEINLTKLNISANPVGHSIVEVLRSEKLKHITSLKVNSCGIDAKQVEFLIRNPHSTKLTSLGIANNSFGSDGAISIFSWLEDLNLQRLDISNNNIGDRGIGGISFNFAFNIRVLKICNNNIGDYGLNVFSKQGFMELKRLDIWGNTFTSEGETLLKSSIYLKKVEIRFSELPNGKVIAPKIHH